jgi:hypothetical protein
MQDQATVTHIVEQGIGLSRVFRRLLNVRKCLAYNQDIEQLSA